MFICWFGDHSEGVTPVLVSIPEVKSFCVLCGTIMSFMGSLKRCRPLSYLHLIYFELILHKFNTIFIKLIISRE